MNKMLILQSFGLGDICFGQGIANHFIEQGYEIIWPVRKQFLNGVQRAYPKVNFIPESIVKPELFDIKEDCIIDDVRVLPIRWSDLILGHSNKSWMKDKYELCGLDYTTWKEGTIFQREPLKEMKLYHFNYGLELNEKYNLISREFTTEANRKIDIQVNNGLKNVVMGFHDGYSLFDHAYLIEHAENIYATNSAIFYLLELLHLRAKEVHLYERTGYEVGFPHVDYLFSKKYITHVKQNQ